MRAAGSPFAGAKRVAWVQADDGFLFYDSGGDGVMEGPEEFVLTNLLSSAPDGTTDLDVLRTFDSNGNGRLDSGDAEFAKFKVWQDLDQDGAHDGGEVKTLAQAGIRDFNLTPHTTSPDGAFYDNGALVFGYGNYVRSNGTSGGFADAGLIHNPGAKTLYENGSAIVADTESGAGRTLAWKASSALNFTAGNSYGGVTGIVNIVGGTGNDTLYGNADANMLVGGDGSDYLNGGDGDDVLVVDSADFSRGVHGGAGSDTLIYDGATGRTINAYTHRVETVFGGSGSDTLDAGYTWHVTFFGGAGNDTLKGHSGDDVLHGGEGADRLYGYAGDDLLMVDDFDSFSYIRGGSGVDTLVFEGAANRCYAMGTLEVENVFAGSGADTITGTAGANVLSGGRGNDTVKGGGGNDSYLFSRGDGADTLSDSGGSDTLALDGVTSTQLSFSRSGADLIMTVSGGGGSIRIKNWASGEQYKVETVVLDDGTFDFQQLYNTAPVADDWRLTIQSGTYGGALGPVRASDADGDALSYSITAVWGYGSASSFWMSGNTLYTSINWNGTSSRQTFLTVQASDGHLSDPATVIIDWAASGGGGLLLPVVIDLDFDGIELVSPSDSRVRIDVDGDGFRDPLGWVAPDDALLALDKNGSGSIDDVSEISFADDLPTASTDLEGLAAYDSNGDGVLDARDDAYDRFVLWQDANQNGRAEDHELMTLAQAGLTAIDLALTPTGASAAGAEDNVILNTAEVHWADGARGTAGDVGFVWESGAPAALDADRFDFARLGGEDSDAVEADLFADARPRAVAEGHAFAQLLGHSLPLLGQAANDPGAEADLMLAGI